MVSYIPHTPAERFHTEGATVRGHSVGDVPGHVHELRVIRGIENLRLEIEPGALAERGDSRLKS
jgi:hypothetical protein